MKGQIACAGLIQKNGKFLMVNDLVVEPRGFLPHNKKIPVPDDELASRFSP